MTRRTFLVAGAAAVTTPLLVGVPAGMAATARANDFGFPPRDRRGVHVKRIAFPVQGPASWSDTYGVSWTDTYGACRDGCRRHHEGQDIFGRKGRRLVAAVSGTIVVLRHRSTGNSIYLKSDADGWYYGYLHINDDSPGTDDGANRFRQAFAPGIRQGAHVRRGQTIAYMGDSGNAESTMPHLHFEIRKPASSVWHSQAVNAKYSLRRASQSRGTRRPSHRAPRHSGSGASARAPSGARAMRQSDRGGNVSALQRALNFGTGTHLVADGSFGPRTVVAVKNLQKWFRLKVDGVYGPRSQRMLQFACNAKRR